MNKLTKFKQTEIGLIPEDWKIELAEKYCERVTDGTHDSPKKKESGKYLITSRHLKNNSLDFENAYFISEDDFEKINRRSEVNQYDIIFSMIGTVGEIYLEKNKEICYTIKNVGLFKFKGDKDKALWFYFYVRSPLGQEYIETRKAGSTQQYLTLDTLRNFPIAYPSSDQERNQIIKILSSLDDKIELLQKQNKTLEAIGQALFKHWFVDFEFPDEEGKPYKSSGGEMVYNEEFEKEIPKGWKVGKLNQIISKINDSTKQGEHLKNRKYVPIDQLPMKNLAFNSYQSFKDAKSSLILFEKNDILLGAMRVYFHRVNISPFAGITRTTTFVFRPKKESLLEYALLLLFQDSTIEFANSQSKGSTMPYAVWKNSLENMKIVIPDNNVVSYFSQLINPIISKIRDSIFELESLQKIRDLLLPKLMTGKIRVPWEGINEV